MMHNFITITFISIFLLNNLSPYLPLLGNQNDEQGWSTPVNLSHSGLSSNPRMVIDSEKQIHAIWIDNVDGYVYSRSKDGKTWSQPVPVSFPFRYSPESRTNDNLPTLVADNMGYIHALWTDQSNVLYYSRVSSANFGISGSWEKRRIVADSALNFDVTIDVNSIVHIVYIRGISDTSPAGVYFRLSNAGSVTWYDPVLIYSSKYFRTLTQTTANVKMSLSLDRFQKKIYVVWDDPNLKQIFMNYSLNGGINWASPTQLVPNDNQSGISYPYHSSIITSGNNILVTWQFGNPGQACFQYSKVSTDDGKNWSNPLSVLDSRIGCPSENSLIKNSSGSIFLLSKLDDQLFITAWDGSRWGSLTRQILPGFTNPQNKNHVSYRCQQALIDNTNQIHVIGCDVAGGNDIWYISKPIGPIADWMASTTTWSIPQIMMDDTSTVSDLSIIADKTNRFVACWIQELILTTNEQQARPLTTVKRKSYIYCSSLNGQQWSSPTSIQFPDLGNPLQLKMTLDGNRLFLTWVDQSSRQMYFSWANVEGASTAITAEWSPPNKLPNLSTGVELSRLIVDRSGTIYIGYSIPINDNRGVYLLKSSDKGENWTGPIQLFADTGSGMNTITQVSLAAASEGKLCAIWTVFPYQIGKDQAKLFSSCSSDKGSSWSKPELLVQGNLTWSELAGPDGKILHRFWQEGDSTAKTIWHQISQDSGKTWSVPTSFTGTGNFNQLPIVTFDTANRIHFFQTNQDPSKDFFVVHWLWSDKGWEKFDSFDIGLNQGDHVTTMAAAISSSGRLIFLYPGKYFLPNQLNPIDAWFTSEEVIQIPAAIQLPAVVSTELPTSVAHQPGEIATATATPINSGNIKPVNNNNPANTSTDKNWIGIILGAGLLVILLIFTIVYRFSISKRR